MSSPLSLTAPPSSPVRQNQADTEDESPEEVEFASRSVRHSENPTSYFNNLSISELSDNFSRSIFFPSGPNSPFKPFNARYDSEPYSTSSNDVDDNPSPRQCEVQSVTYPHTNFENNFFKPIEDDPTETVQPIFLGVKRKTVSPTDEFGGNDMRKAEAEIVPPIPKRLRTEA